MKTLCKKSYFYINNNIFIKNKWYNIKYINEYTNYNLMLVKSEYGRFYFIPNSYEDKQYIWKNWIFEDYFYTEKQVRQLKLKQLK